MQAEPDLSKSISDIFAKVFTGLQSLHIMSNTGAGKDLTGRKSAIRAVQQFDKHKKLFSPQQQKAFSKWCESKVCKFHDCKILGQYLALVMCAVFAFPPLLADLRSNLLLTCQSSFNL